MGNLMQGRSTTDISDQTGRGKVEEIWSSNHANHITTLPGGLSHIRESIDLGTSPETFDFSTTPIIAATIYFYADAGTLTGTQMSAAICIDPPNAAVRDAWLTAADSLTVDTQRIPVFKDNILELSFTSAISYIGAKIDVGTTAEGRMIIVGVEA